MTGNKPVKVRWVDVNKGDDESSNVRCRIVARDLNIGKRPTATRVLEVPCVEVRQLGSEKTKLMT